MRPNWSIWPILSDLFGYLAKSRKKHSAVLAKTFLSSILEKGSLRNSVNQKRIQFTKFVVDYFFKKTHPNLNRFT